MNKRSIKQGGGINSNQKAEGWVLALLGGLFFIVGVWASVHFLPDSIRSGEYSDLFLLLFVFAGIGLLYAALKQIQAYKRFGATPLFLDPSVPSLGGHLGGRFSINSQDIDQNASSTTPFCAKITCTRRDKNRDHTTYEVIWQDKGPVHLKQTAHGVDASFVFNIPNTCKATQELSRRLSSSTRSFIEWQVSAEGDFSTSSLGKFERNWAVVVEDNDARQATD
ncbi:MAG: hypothetical protein COB38_00975 [Gammaproteobacteria bacterium]|nr:MAG: hypothetical protein COB38_00975 [Gammaproteobacteria bacterium]